MKNSDYKQIDGKILHRLEKPKSRTHIIFVEDLGMDDEGWFISVKWIYTKTGEIKRESCIIRKSISDWLNPLLRDGWEEIQL
jgi:hypothetical protein